MRFAPWVFARCGISHDEPSCASSRAICFINISARRAVSYMVPHHVLRYAEEESGLEHHLEPPTKAG